MLLHLIFRGTWMCLPNCIKYPGLCIIRSKLHFRKFMIGLPEIIGTTFCVIGHNISNGLSMWSHSISTKRKFCLYFTETPFETENDTRERALMIQGQSLTESFNQEQALLQFGVTLSWRAITLHAAINTDNYIHFHSKNVWWFGVTNHV